MSEYYFTNSPTSKNKPKFFTYTFGKYTIKLASNSGVFSASQVDFGSDLLISTLCDLRNWNDVKTLDIGCGYGVLGLSFSLLGANVTMCDVNQRAIDLSKENALINNLKAVSVLSDAASDINELFDVVVTNPPIRAGKHIVYTIFDNSFRVLKLNGDLYVVIRKQQGAESAKRYIIDLFGNCDIINRKAGYWILHAIKR